jgi:hypothetical protein
VAERMHDDQRQMRETHGEIRSVIALLRASMHEPQ